MVNVKKTLFTNFLEGYETSRSKQAPFPFTKEVTVDTIASVGNKLWKELVGHQEKLRVTCVHLAFTGIEFAESGQQTIEDFLKPSSSKKRLPDQEPEILPGVKSGEDLDPKMGAENVIYTCPRCGKSIYSPAQADVWEGGQDGIIDPDYIAKVKSEHEDFHFAQDLANEGKPRSVISVTSKSPRVAPSAAKRRKPPSEPNGIEKFFRRS